MGSLHTQRLQRVRSLFDIQGSKAVLLHGRYDITWCCGFTGSSSTLLLEETGSTLFTDGRYTEQAATEAPSVVVEVVGGDRVQAIAAYLTRKGLRNVLFQGDIVTVSQLNRLREGSASDTVFAPCGGMLKTLRAQKTDDEIEQIRKALSLSEMVLSEAHDLIIPGVTELDLATELDYRHLRYGAERPSFETIVAFGSHAALPHARPGHRKLKEREVVLIDFGCMVDGYCSDITRMFSLGEPENDISEAYQVVDEALQMATSGAKAGISGRSLDGIARDRLSTAGLADYFSHGLGHGVGLEIHEWPAINARNVETLLSDTVITIEPGVYRKGRFGIRIENMIRISEDGCDVLNSSGTQLTII